MIKIGARTRIEEISKNKKTKSKNKEVKKTPYTVQSTLRPEVVDAMVYKLKSAFVKNSVFITLSYVKEDAEIKPIDPPSFIIFSTCW